MRNDKSKDKKEKSVSNLVFYISGLIFIGIFVFSLLMLHVLNVEKKDKDDDGSASKHFYKDYLISEGKFYKFEDLKLVATLDEGLFAQSNTSSELESVSPKLFKNKSIQKILSISPDELLILTEKHGLFSSRDNLKSFQSINYGLPLKKYVIDGSITEKAYSKINDITYDVDNPDVLFVCYNNEIYKSDDRGKKWELYLDCRGTRYDGVVSLSYIELEKSVLFIGTSDQGLFYQDTPDGEVKSVKIKDFPKFGNSFEEITALTIDKSNNVLYCGFKERNLLWKIDIKDFRNNYMISLPQINNEFLINYNEINDINVSNYLNNKKIYSSTINGMFESRNGKTFDKWNWRKYVPEVERKNISSAILFKQPDNLLSIHGIADLKRRKRYFSQENRFDSNQNISAVFINLDYLTNIEEFKIIIDRLVEKGINTVCLKLKGTDGTIYFNTMNKLLRSSGAIKEKISIQKLIVELKKRHLKIIGYISIFKDNNLAIYKNNKFALKNKKTGEVYIDIDGNRYIDVSSKELWEMYSSLMLEIEKLGFDELLFDYAGYPLYNCSSCYRFLSSGKLKPDEVVESFLLYMKKRLSIPFGVAIRGLSGWNRQHGHCMNIESICELVDVIYPVYFPSLMDENLYNSPPQEDRPRRIYYYGLNRLKSLINKKIAIRPFLQAFTSKYADGLLQSIEEVSILKQITGCRDAGINSFLFYNNYNQYDKVELFEKVDERDEIQ